jgi:hypothetical protein
VDAGGVESRNIHFSSSSPSLRGSVTFVDDCLDRPALKEHKWDLLACRPCDLGELDVGQACWRWYLPGCLVNWLSNNERILVGGLHEACHALDVTSEVAQLLGMILI